MNNQYFDHCMKKATEKYIHNQAEPDSERLWQRIIGTIETYESGQASQQKKEIHRNSLTIKVATILVTAVIILELISFTKVGEAFPAFSLSNLYKLIISETQMLIRFDTQETPTPGDIQRPDLEGIVEIAPPGYDFIEIDLVELLNLYAGHLYMPADIPLNRLDKAQYSETANLWVILMEFREDDVNILFSQKDSAEGGYYGTGYDPEDTNFTTHEINGIEYLVYKRRYNIVEVDWLMYGKTFSITGNISEEEALRLAQSVGIYKPVKP